MTYVVQWDQWYRCGRFGDDKDFDTMTMEFDTLAAALSFVDDLVADKHRGRFDMKVHRREVNIFSK